MPESRCTRRGMLGRMAAGTAALCAPEWLSGEPAPGGIRPTEKTQSKPNIVILVADDLGWNDVSFHGGQIKTPHIDGIAREGVEMDRFYACPICSPTRAGLMTGRWPLRFGIMRAVIPPWRDYGLPDDEETLAQMLGRAGYRRRGCFGKWHLGHSRKRYHPLNRGFTHFYGCYNGAIDYFSHQREGELDWHRNYAPAREEGYSTELLAAEAAKFVADSPAGEPFFLYLPFNAPHTPLQAPEPWLRKYAHLDGDRQKYAAMVACMDDAVGRVLAAVAARGNADNTFVLFFSDNGGGPGADNAPLRGAKQTTFEGGTRVAAAARWPAGGLTGGRKVSAVMGYIDVLPTLRRIVGAGPHQGKPLDGVDVYDALAGKADPPQRKWFSYWAQGGDEQERLAVIDGEWKLVREGPAILAPASAGQDAGTEKLWLFRIDEDPNERTDLAAKHPEVVRRLLKDLRAFRSLRCEGGLPPYGQGRKGFKAPKDWIAPD